jgi:hypothetical protein
MFRCTLLSIVIVAGALGASATAQPATPQVVIEPAAPTVDLGAEMVCRKVKETGSLVKSKKTCHTKSQWSYIDDQHQRFGRQMVQDGTTRPAGN